jgi:hypothetical protein
MVNASEWGRRGEEWTTSLPSDVQKLKPAQIGNAADAEALVPTVQSDLEMKLGD